jgi:hypothetical protein
MESNDDIMRLWSQCGGLEFLDMIASGRVPHSPNSEFLGLKRLRGQRARRVHSNQRYLPAQESS